MQAFLDKARGIIHIYKWGLDIAKAIPSASGLVPVKLSISNNAKASLCVFQKQHLLHRKNNVFAAQVMGMLNKGYLGCKE